MERIKLLVHTSATISIRKNTSFNMEVKGVRILGCRQDKLPSSKYNKHMSHMILLSKSKT